MAPAYLRNTRRDVFSFKDAPESMDRKPAVREIDADQPHREEIR